MGKGEAQEKGEKEAEKTAESADTEKGRSIQVRYNQQKENELQKRGAQEKGEAHSELARQVEELEVERQREAEPEAESTKGKTIEERISIQKRRNI